MTDSGAERAARRIAAPLEVCHDISLWYSWVKREKAGVCPNCEYDLRHMHPEANLYPHFTGACAAAPDEGGKR